MSTKQSAYFKGFTRKQVNDSGRAGVCNSYLHTHSFAEAVATTDVLELFPLPPGAQIVGFSISPVNLAGVSLTVGIMTGTPGDVETARTCGTELLNASAAATPASATLAALAAVTPSANARAIGFVPGANIAADATKKITIKVDFTLP